MLYIHLLQSGADTSLVTFLFRGGKAGGANGNSPCVGGHDDDVIPEGNFSADLVVHKPGAVQDLQEQIVGVGRHDGIVAVSGVDGIEGRLAGADAAQPVVLQHGQRTHPDVDTVGSGVVGEVTDTGEAADDRVRQDKVERHQRKGCQQNGA